MNIMKFLKILKKLLREKNNFGLRDDELEIIKEKFQKNNFDLDKVFIFGSRAMGNFRKNSDIDLVYFGEKNENDFYNLKTDLEEKTFLPYKFDILFFDEIKNDELKKHIKKYGKKII